MESRPSRGVLLLAGATLCVSTSGILAQRALQEASAVATAAWRLGAASLFFAAWAGFRQASSRAARRTGSAGSTYSRAGAAPGPGRLSRTPTQASGDLSSHRPDRPSRPQTDNRLQGAEWLRLCAAGVLLALHFIAWFASLTIDPVGRATLLVCTTPLWTAMFDLAIHRRWPERGYMLALAMAGAGVWLISSAAPGRSGLEAGAPLWKGDLLAVTGGLFFALYLMTLEGLHARLSSRQQVTVSYTTAAIVLWGAFLAQGGVRIDYSARAWVAIAGLALVPQICGHTLFNASLRYFRPATIALAGLVEPALAAVWAWLLLQQAVTPGQAAGGALVIGGLAAAIRAHPPAPAGAGEPAV